MISAGDNIMVCLSGGKDSFTLLKILTLLQKKRAVDFSIFSFTLDQGQPGWQDDQLRDWLTTNDINHTILTKNTYSIVTDKIPPNKTYCSLCSRLRRGIIYSYAEENNRKKIALGHHRDDLIRTLLMSIFYNGTIGSMPAKLLTDDKKQIVIRPLVYCQEADIIAYAKEQQFPIIPCNLCGSQENLARKKMQALIEQLAQDNPKIPSNMLHALTHVRPSQLLDKKLMNFAHLEDQLW